MNSFKEENLKLIRKDIEQALVAVEEKHGIHLSLHKFTFSPEDFSTKLSATIPVEDGIGKEESNFILMAKEYGRSYGFSESDFHRTFTHNGKTYKLMGFAPRSKKYPFLAVDEAGERYKFPRSVIAMLK